jgi:hypothetical protein
MPVEWFMDEIITNWRFKTAFEKENYSGTFYSFDVQFTHMC